MFEGSREVKEWSRETKTGFKMSDEVIGLLPLAAPFCIALNGMTLCDRETFVECMVVSRAYALPKGQERPRKAKKGRDQ